MKFIVDGYNLLYQSPVMQTGSGAKFLQTQRHRLMTVLASLMNESDRNATLVVFDSSQSHGKSNLDDSIHGIKVRYAYEHLEADDLIEDIIEEHPQPQSLWVVSSDRRIQRAAKRRKAKFVDSREWLDSLYDTQARQLVTKQSSRGKRTISDGDVEAKFRTVPLDNSTVLMWMQAMGFETVAESSKGSSSKVKPSNTNPSQETESDDKSLDETKLLESMSADSSHFNLPKVDKESPHIAIEKAIEKGHVKAIAKKNTSTKKMPKGSRDSLSDSLTSAQMHHRKSASKREPANQVEQKKLASKKKTKVDAKVARRRARRVLEEDKPIFPAEYLKEIDPNGFA